MAIIGISGKVGSGNFQLITILKPIIRFSGKIYFYIK